MRTEEQLKEYIFCELASDADPNKFDYDSELIEGGLLDSHALLRLLSHLEEAHSVDFEAGELVMDNLGSIRKLADFIRRKRGEHVV